MKIDFGRLRNCEKYKKFKANIHLQICEMHREIDQQLPRSHYFGDDANVAINAVHQRKHVLT